LGVTTASQQNSYMDPHGFVLDRHDRVLRIIRPDSREFYDSLVDNPTIKSLQRRGALIDARRARQAPPEHEGALVLEHPKLWPITYASEWTPSALRDAALLTLDIAGEVTAIALTLQDATPWNVLFANGRPIFVDFTSFVPQDLHVLWKAQSQFEALFYRPLLLSSKGRGTVARHLLGNPIIGVSEEEFSGLVSPGYKLAHPRTFLASRIARWIQNDPARRQNFIASVRSRRTELGAPLRRRFLRSQAARLEAMRFPQSGDTWNEYYRTIPAGIDKTWKLSLVEKTVERFKPATVVDIGANTGVFSALAAKYAGTVVAVDNSQSCTEAIYAMAKSRSLAISTVTCDLIAPPLPAGMLTGDYPPLWSRLRSSMSLCLGLMHHLHITGRQPFARISSLLDALTERVAIFEFISADDENVRRLDILEPPRYALEQVLDALRHNFPNIEVLDSDRPTRKVLICQK